MLPVVDIRTLASMVREPSFHIFSTLSARVQLAVAKNTFDHGVCRVMTLWLCLKSNLKRLQTPLLVIAALRSPSLPWFLDPSFQDLTLSGLVALEKSATVLQGTIEETASANACSCLLPKTRKTPALPHVQASKNGGCTSNCTSTRLNKRFPAGRSTVDVCLGNVLGGFL
jgi:hypothetical protein